MKVEQAIKLALAVAVALAIFKWAISKAPAPVSTVGAYLP